MGHEHIQMARDAIDAMRRTHGAVERGSAVSFPLLLRGIARRRCCSARYNAQQQTRRKNAVNAISLQ
jgi:hypothetical protein